MRQEFGDTDFTRAGSGIRALPVSGVTHHFTQGGFAGSITRSGPRTSRSQTRPQTWPQTWDESRRRGNAVPPRRRSASTIRTEDPTEDRAEVGAGVKRLPIDRRSTKPALDIDGGSRRRYGPESPLKTIT
jgi:hypothetical protein